MCGRKVIKPRKVELDLKLVNSSFLFIQNQTQKVGGVTGELCDNFYRSSLVIRRARWRHRAAMDNSTRFKGRGFFRSFPYSSFSASMTVSSRIEIFSSCS